MTPLSIHLFGQFSLACQGQLLAGLEGARVQELFCFLLTHRNTVFLRETLAAQFWGDTTTKQSRKNLRQTLWKLQAALEALTATGRGRLINADTGTIQLSLGADLWIDVAEFEQAFTSVRSGRAATAQQAQSLSAAVQLYRGDLLAGWQQDWCLCERERLQNMYLWMLDWLVCFCETHADYQAGRDYGERILQLDPLRERTHQQLMRMHYVAGDRATALAQYERCVKALRSELGVGPSAPTLLLCEQIRAEQLPANGEIKAPAPPPPPASLPDILTHLHSLQSTLSTLQHQVRQDIGIVEQLLLQRREPI